MNTVDDSTSPRPLAGTGSVLTMNGGSSSIRFALFEQGRPPRRAWAGKIDRIGLLDATLTLGRTNDVPRSVPIDVPDHDAAAGVLIGHLGRELGDASVAAIGHRIVHGGPQYARPELVTPDLLAELRRISPWDPAHLPSEIALVEALGRRYPGVPQYACFDTAFHRDMPRVATLLPLPRRFEAQGVRRYGFHGLSYTFLMDELARIAGPEAARGRVVLAHLGNGASLAAVRDGKSLDTSMAFTPAAGVPMGTRAGDLDPGLIGYLARAEGMSPEQFDDMVHRRSGLLGVSGTSSDMRDLLARELDGDARAADAVALFCYQVKKWIGGFAAALGGVDTLVFSGGIGERAAVVRTRICEGLAFLGVELDPARNAANAAVVSASAGRVIVRVIPTDEEQVIAEAACGLSAGDPR